MTAPRSYKATAIVLRARNLGEADKIYTLFTRERGKVDAVGKGVRRAKSSLAGRLEFMNEVALTLHRGRSLDVITAAQIERSYFDAIVQPPAFLATSLMGELVDAFCEPDLAVPEIFNLLHLALHAVRQSPDPLALLPRFELRLLDALGLAPPTEQCVRCGASLLDRAAWLDTESGGLAGLECRATWMNVIELDADDVRNVQALSAARDSARRATLLARPQVARAIDALVAYHLGRRPKAGAQTAEFVRPAS
ncbi:MAG: DNA repair protein RecO [Candidatus Eremiobacteraeota bacterium]|nr:DNA repair protein RecO [Candidatus Eremiobacteraeota bacterium]